MIEHVPARFKMSSLPELQVVNDCVKRVWTVRLIESGKEREKERRIIVGELTALCTFTCVF